MAVLEFIARSRARVCIRLSVVLLELIQVFGHGRLFADFYVYNDRVGVVQDQRLVVFEPFESVWKVKLSKVIEPSFFRVHRSASCGRVIECRFAGDKM